MAATTTVRVHRRKSPAAARRSETIAAARDRLVTAAARAWDALPHWERPLRSRKAPAAAPDPAAAASIAAEARGTSSAGLAIAVTGPAGVLPVGDAAPSAAVGSPDAAPAVAPTPASRPAADLLNPVRPATSQPLCAGAGAFQADPFIAARARRGTYALDAPSWRAFRSYVTDRSNFDELRAVGLAAMVRSHRSLSLALAAVILGALLTVAAMAAYLLLAPATADADSPYVTAEVSKPVSTPASQWKAGEIPSLYQSDAAWGATPYGQSTLADAGGAPTALAMAYVAVTGQADRTPVDFAQWAADHDLTASGVDTVRAYLTQSAADFGLTLNPIAGDAHSLRRAIVSNIPVLVVTEPGTFSPVASVVVLDDIDRDSRIVLHDPTSATRTNKSWDFDDITDAAAAVYEVYAA